MTKEVSIILPAYNEADKVEHAVKRTAEELVKIGYGYSFEIILAEDGSTDGSDAIAAELADKYAFVKHLHSDKRLGKGNALKKACKEAQGSIIAYFDIDLSTDMRHVEELIRAIEKDGFDFATGSRLLPESEVKRPLKRDIPSTVYNSLVRMVLHSELHDHQCGFKASLRASLFAILDEINDPHWFWDTELLVRAQYHGYKVKEFPVKWDQGSTTKVKFFKDVVTMGSKIIALWWDLRRKQENKKYSHFKK